MFFELPSSITKSIILRHKNTYTILWNWVIPEKIQTGVGVGRGNTFLKKRPGIFWFVTLPLEIPEKTNFHPWKLVWPMKILHGFFLNTPGNSTFFNWPLEFSRFFFNSPGNSMSSTLPFWIFLEWPIWCSIYIKFHFRGILLSWS